MLIRVGLDGLTEATRMRVNKRIRNEDVIRYFERMTEAGMVQFKIFMVFGYPWETLADFDEWEWLRDRIAAIPRKTNANVRIKFTPLIPQPATPLADSEPKYDHEMVHRINEWFERHRSPRRQPGWYFISDGIMSERSHRLQVMLTRGDESLLTGDRDWSGAQKLRGYELAWHAGL